ncbi:hypothetical protein, partial [Azospirillum sp. B4]|uniref:hypothetical protein n=1 Tax=Azospirillum sp. B4 TaxID=95605 RepID=UPI0018FF3114
MPDAGLPGPRAAVVQASDVVVVRLRQEQPDMAERQDIACQDAFAAIIQLRDFARHELWRGGRLVFGGGHARRALAITHLEEGWACRHLSAFDNVRFHIPRASLDAVTAELGRPAIRGFACARGTVDPVAHSLASALLPMLEGPAMDAQGRGSRLFVDQVTLALMLHVAETYGGMVSLATPGG